MSSLITQAFVFEHYGPRLDRDQIAKVLGVGASTILNKRSENKLPVKTYIDPTNGKVYADYRDIAAYIDDCKQLAA